MRVKCTGTAANLEKHKRNVGVEFRGIQGFPFGSIICLPRETTQHGAWRSRLVKSTTFFKPETFDSM